LSLGYELREGTKVLAQGNGGVAFHLICAVIGLIILGMAADEWRRLGAAEYGRLAAAAGVLLLGRVAGAALVLTGRQPEGLWFEGFLEGATLAAFTWACLFQTFSPPRRANLFLAASALLLGSLLAWDLLTGPSLAAPAPWSALLLLLSGFALVQWGRHWRRSLLWTGGAFLLSLLSAGLALLGRQPAALLGHLAALPLFAVGTYRAIVLDLSAYGLELKAIGEQTLRQTEEMAFLLEVNQAIAASLELPVVLERVSEAAARAVNADWAYILLPKEGRGEEMTVAARYSWWGRRWTQESQVQRELTIRLADYPLLRHAVLRQRQLLANRPEEYEQFEPLHRLLSRPQAGPTLIQPIYLQERSLGALLLGHAGAQRTFNEADGRLCQGLVAQVATAMENARLYQSLDEQARQLADLLRAREQELAQRLAILESIADGVVVASEAGEVVLVNAAAEAILGLPRQQLLGRTFQRLYTELLLAGGQAVFEWGDKLVRGSLAPVKMSDGSLLGHVAVLRDVTRERQAEEAKSKFIATISHELRTPMTSIKGYVELLVAGAAGRLTAQQRQFLEVVAANAERMVGLVNNLIAVSQVERGTIQIEAQAVDMRQIIEEAVQAIRPQAAERQLDLATNLPPGACPVQGDPYFLRQIMDNLLSNALRYTPPQGRITIWTAEAHLEDGQGAPQCYLVVNVRDTGVGIPAEEQDRIFEPFYRVENPLSLEAGGVGMGLAIVRRLVEAHGGRIWVESQPNAGSTFSFVIPTAPP